MSFVMGGSSVVEQDAVNVLVAGSSPALPASSAHQPEQNAATANIAPSRPAVAATIHGAQA